MRAGEVHGRDYFFVSRAQFEAWLAEGNQLLEHALVYGDYKGIPRQQVRTPPQSSARHVSTNFIQPWYVSARWLCPVVPRAEGPPVHLLRACCWRAISCRRWQVALRS